MFSPAGIFVWWPKVENVTLTSYVIQFQSNETTAFSDVIGTTTIIDEFHTWTDISGDLTNIPATTNTHPFSTNHDHETTPGNDTFTPKTITELRVSGNVSGILIPNTREIVVRVIVPIINDDGSELHQDLTYVEWIKVSNDYLFFCAIV